MGSSVNPAMAVGYKQLGRGEIMTELEHDRINAFDIFLRTFKTIKETPALCIPFFFVGVFNFLWLSLVYFAPRYPISLLMAPPIRKIWGGEFLTYPRNFVLIPKLYFYGELALVCTVGLCATAYALWLLKCSYGTTEPKRFSSLKAYGKAFKNYLRMVIIYLVLYYLIKVIAVVFLSLLRPLFQMNPYTVLLTVPLEVLIVTAIQGLFFFVFPAFIIGEKKLIKGLIENFQLFFTNTRAIFVLIILPSLLFIPAKALFIFNPLIAQRLGYESICYIIVLNIIVNVIADICISLCAGVAYIEIMKVQDTNTNKGELGGKQNG
jgi:hypothetical protein